jgi:hypothetical protein
MGDEHLDPVPDASVEEETGGQLGHGRIRLAGTRKRPKEPYRTVTPTTLPSKLGLAAAAPVSSHLVSLAAIVAVDRGPGPMIAHQSGVGATGPFGQTERYRQAMGANNRLVHELGPLGRRVVHDSRTPWTTCG